MRRSRSTRPTGPDLVAEPVPGASLPPEAGAVLLALARGAVARGLGVEAPAARRPAWLAGPGACFVTVWLDGRLRGCIGSTTARRPLGDDVEANARAAAFRDPRFVPLSRAELDRVRLEVSVLTPAEPVEVRDEADAIARLRPGVDGVVLTCGPHRATLLPQVWDHLTDPRAFLTALRTKAGLPGDFWSQDVRLDRYTVTAYQED